jgi:hypothetical protein
MLDELLEEYVPVRNNYIKWITEASGNGKNMKLITLHNMIKLFK